MSEGLFTVDTAAEELKLHPKTVLRFIREGRLRATKVGRQYRILRSDLRALIDGQGSPGRSSRVARTTAVLEISGAGVEFAQRMAALTTGLRVERPAPLGTLSVDVVHDQKGAHLKVIAIGSPGDVARVLQLAEVLLEG